MKHIKTTIFTFLCTLTLSLTAAESVHMANGIKIGEVTSDSAIIWTRLTITPEANWEGIPFKPNDSKVPQGKTLAEMQGSAMGAAGEVMIAYVRTDIPKGDSELLATLCEKVDPKADFTRQITYNH